jgi:hypothetical protein
MSIASPPAVPRFYWSRFCREAEDGGPIQPCLIAIKDEEAVLIGLDLFHWAMMSSDILPAKGRKLEEWKSTWMEPKR